MLTNGQLTRLKNELRQMQALQAASSLISFRALGVPPTKYEVELRCRGIYLSNEGVTYTDHHAFDIIIDGHFPATAPTLVWKTSIFHPNFREPHVCIGDYWFPGSSLAQMCVSICEMVQYKVFNIYDPLNREAALWIDLYTSEGQAEKLPIDARPVTDLHFEIGVNHTTSEALR